MIRFPRMRQWGMLIIVLILSTITSRVYAQFADTIRTGRPGQAIGAFTVGKGVLQVQSGVTRGIVDWSNSVEEFRSLVSNTVIRYGIRELVEVSGVMEWSANRQVNEIGAMDLGGLSAAQLGFRVNLRQRHDRGPNIGFQSRVRLNILGDDFPQENLGTTSILSISQPLGETFALGTNWGITWSGTGGSPTGFYAVTLGFPLSERVSGFVENYGSLANQNFDTRFDTGLGWVINADLQLDFSIGYGRNDGITDYFADVGFSWRTHTRINH